VRRILLVGDYPPPYGGLSVQVASLRHRLAARGDTEVQVLDIGSRRRQTRPGCLPARGPVGLAVTILGYARRGFTPHVHTNGHNAKSWLVTLIFRHAVHYIYGQQVVGVMWQGVDFLFPTTFAPDGIRSEPSAAIREVWSTPVSHHRHDEAVVVRFTADRRLEVLDEWPAAFGALPPGAIYAPRARIVHGPPPAAARILARER